MSFNPDPDHTFRTQLPPQLGSQSSAEECRVDLDGDDDSEPSVCDDADSSGGVWVDEDAEEETVEAAKLAAGAEAADEDPWGSTVSPTEEKLEAVTARRLEREAQIDAFGSRLLPSSRWSGFQKTGKDAMHWIGTHPKTSIAALAALGMAARHASYIGTEYLSGGGDSNRSMLEIVSAAEGKLVADGKATNAATKDTMNSAASWVRSTCGDVVGGPVPKWVQKFGDTLIGTGGAAF